VTPAGMRSKRPSSYCPWAVVAQANQTLGRRILHLALRRASRAGFFSKLLNPRHAHGSSISV
jgi:hypothetical protein